MIQQMKAKYIDPTPTNPNQKHQTQTFFLSRKKFTKLLTIEYFVLLLYYQTKKLNAENRPQVSDPYAVHWGFDYLCANLTYRKKRI